MDRADRLVRQWGETATALGWNVDELIGVDMAAWARIDRRGAFMLFPDGEVVALTAEAVVLRVGSRVMTYRRRVAG